MATVAADSNQEQNKKPNLNDIINDLNLISKASSNLALTLAIYANLKGELDTTKYKILDEEEQKQKG